MAMMDHLYRIAQADPLIRRNQLQQILTEIGCPFTVYSDVVRGLTPQNVVVSFREGKPRMVIGAHYDSVQGSSGANDNTASVCVLLALLEGLKDRPPTFPLDVVFFDLEEGALAGSQAYIDRFGADTIAGMINLDVCGVGDTILVAPAAQLTGTILAGPITAVANTNQHPVQILELLPSGDEVSFLNAGIPALTVAVLPHDEVPLLKEAMTKLMQGEQPERMPPILETMHNGPRDSIAVIEPQAMQLTLEWIDAVVQAFNKASFS